MTAGRAPPGRVVPVGIVTFARGGTLSNVTIGRRSCTRTTGLGIWERAGAHEFTAVTMVFLGSPVITDSAIVIVDTNGSPDTHCRSWS